MSKTKHHYVPRFYLKWFASKPRRVNVYTLGSQRFLKDVSLKDQCQRPRFYGKADDVEDDLMKLETIVSPALREIVEDSKLPDIGSMQHTHVLLFAAFQLSRTPMAATAMSEGFNKMIDLVNPKVGKGGKELEEQRMKFDFAVQESLRNSALVAEYWADLEVHLLVNSGDQGFLTSDNPVVLYNKYCEGLKGFGTTGAVKRGLQVFLPLSPRHLILFYDKHVYKVGVKNSRTTEVSSFNDIRSINQLQTVNADQVLLFSNWNDVEAITKLINRGKKYRRPEVSEVEEFLAEDDPERESLLKLYPVPLDVKLDLSFMQLRRKAQAVPRRQRALEYRNRSTLIEQYRPGSGRQAGSRRFVRKDLLPRE
jgi:hypothetical protein